MEILKNYTLWVLKSVLSHRSRELVYWSLTREAWGHKGALILFYFWLQNRLWQPEKVLRQMTIQLGVGNLAMDPQNSSSEDSTPGQADAPRASVKPLCAHRSHSASCARCHYHHNRSGAPGEGDVNTEAPTDDCAPSLQGPSQFAKVVNVRI